MKQAAEVCHRAHLNAVRDAAALREALQSAVDGRLSTNADVSGMKVPARTGRVMSAQAVSGCAQFSTTPDEFAIAH
jgi:hypothetical protein